MLGSCVLALCLAAAGPADGGAPETVVTAPRADPSLPEGRATSVVSRAELEERLPRSAPDALRFEPGVFVQQSAHGQGSAYLRGLTGQQTLLAFDGLRLNTSTWRQGPNQYFFTLDARSLDSIEVLRGGASTRYGSDAMGGVLLAHPREPSGRAGVRPSLTLRGASADSEYGGRLELDAALGPVAVLGGVGARHAGLLRASGPVYSPVTGAPAGVPRFGPDGQAQLGTGFDEVTADLRAVARPADRQRLTLAGYGYFQLDAPRTDVCPPAGARFDECLTYERQQRTLVLGHWDAAWDAVESSRVSAWWQRQYERRRAERPASFFVERGEDTVDTLGVAARVKLRRLGPLGLSAGVDTALDLLGSSATVGFTDLNVVVPKSRGQYLDRSRYLTGGAFAEAAALLGPATLRAGGRVAWARADAPADFSSGSAAVAQGWLAPVGFAGLELRLAPSFGVLLNVDHSFRAPNLDDLTSRQQTGPGFQFENAALRPERATTAELGARLTTRRVRVEAFVFGTVLTDAITRAPRDVTQCPPATPQCPASQARHQLVNVDGLSTLAGAELSARVTPVDGLLLQGAVSWAWGEGPNPAAGARPRVPLSRVPPLNGSVEAVWRSTFGLSAGAAVRWAGPQLRLAPSDLSDSRIPEGGTGGFAVVDLRGAWRFGANVVGAVVLENLFDTAYRYHGSSVNGPARGVVVTVELAPW